MPIHRDIGRVDLIESIGIIKPQAGFAQHAIYADKGNSGNQHGNGIGQRKIAPVSLLHAQPEMQADEQVYPDDHDKDNQLDQEDRFQ